MGDDDRLELELERVARSVGDGRPVDWNAETTTLPALETLLQELRFIEMIAAAHGSARGEGSGSPPVLSGARPGGAPPAAVGPREAAVGGRTWGSLQILERIGAGGFGEVFRAIDTTLQREVALKLLRPGREGIEQSEARFLREARHLSLVRHPNVVTVFGAARHGGRVGLWAEIITGHTLEQLLDRLGRMGAREAASIGIDVCRALAAVHERKLVHCDVKAANVMREEGGRLVLMDFGAATRLPGFTTSGVLQSEMAATLLSVAPEVLRGGRPIAASDVYGVGVLLYRLVSLRHPVEARSVPELLARFTGGRHTPLRDLRPGLPEGFVRIVERAIHVEPGQRFESAGAMERALVEILASL